MNLKIKKILSGICIAAIVSSMSFATNFANASDFKTIAECEISKELEQVTENWSNRNISSKKQAAEFLQNFELMAKQKENAAFKDIENLFGYDDKMLKSIASEIEWKEGEKLPRGWFCKVRTAVRNAWYSFWDGFYETCC